MPQHAVEVLERETGETIYSDGGTRDRSCTRPRFHPDETVIAYVCRMDGQTYVIVYDFQADTKTEIAVPQVNACVRWSAAQ